MSSYSDKTSSDSDRDGSIEKTAEDELRPEPHLLGKINCDPKPLGYVLPQSSDEEVVSEKFMQGKCGLDDAPSMAADSISEQSELGD